MKKIRLNKVLRIGLAICMMVMCFQGCAANRVSEEEKNHSEYKGSIDVWAWNDELLTSGMIDGFNEKYPNIIVNLITIPNDNNAYSTKLIATLRSGVCPPDVYLGESANIKKLSNMDYYEDLSQEPYNAEELTKKMVPYTVELGRNDKDNSIRALTWQATPGGFFYRRSLAREYLGTDNPEEVSGMLSTMDDYIALGEKLKEQSGGKVNLLANYSELLYVVLGSRTEGWVKDNKLNIDPAMMEYIDLAAKIRSEGLDINAKQWTPNWTAAMGAGSVFGFMLPTWGINNVLEANAPETEGDWAFIKAPTPYYWGGSWIGMYKDSKKKDLSWLFIKFLTTNEEFLTKYAIDSGDYVNNVDVQDKISNSADGNNKFLGGQNAYKSYTELVGSVKGDTLTQYDETINTLWSNNVEQYITGKMSKEAAIAKFKEDVHKEFPKIEVQ